MSAALLQTPNPSSAADFLARYDGLAARLPGEPAPRRAAAEILRAHGLPSMREESWRYTSLLPVAEARFHEALTEASGFEPDHHMPALGDLQDAPRLVFVQGRFSAAQSVLPKLANVASFAATADLGLLPQPDRERLVALNTMLAEDGAIIDVPEGVDAGTIVLISIGHDISGTSIAFHPRHAIRLAAGAQLTVVELATGRGQYLHNPVTEIVLAPGARLSHVRLQNEAPTAFHLATIYADIATDATYDGFTLTTGARLARTDVHARLSGTGGHAAINTAQLLRGRQHSDFTTVMNHDAPNCASRQTVKHVLAGHARGVFQGRIEVARAAQKTDGYQMNQALLLSPDAEIDCKPQLEIFADDVKCSHGATVGELDADQLFYMVSRGIPLAEARAILVRAFLGEALDMVQDEGARALLDGVIDAWWEAPPMNATSKLADLAPSFDVNQIRADFPILGQSVHGKPLVFLDSAASAQKPRAVIAAMTHAMESQYANVHRGLHWMSERTSDAYEGVRDKVATLLNAPSREEIVFVRNTTEAINMVAHSYGRGVLQPGQAVLITEMEHHANIVPWQMLRDDRGIELRVAPITDAGELDMDAFARLLDDGRVGLVAVTQMSNVLGTYNPIARIAALAHAAGAQLLVDGSQAVVHRAVDVQALGADFYVFTGHKLYGPTGVGVLWARRALLDAMPPFMGGGDMIATVSFERSTWAPPPTKFEAGTPAILEVIGLGAAIDYVNAIGFPAIAAHEAALTDHALARLSAIDGLHIVGQAQDRGGVISFTLDGAHAHDIATLLDRNGIAVRAGQHCAEPLMRRLGLSSTARASFGIYTTKAEIDFLADTLVRVRGFFQ